MEEMKRVDRYILGAFFQSGHTLDDSSYRLNFDLGKKNEIHHYS